MNVIIVVVGSIVFIGILLFVLYLILTNRKRISNFMTSFHTTLLQEGINAAVTTDTNYYLDRIGQTVKETSDFIEGVFEIKSEEFDYIFFRTRELNNYWDFIVTGDTLIDNTLKTHWTTSIFYQRVTRLYVQQGSHVFGKPATIYWKGDERLSNVLNTDNMLSEKIISVLSKRRQLKKIFIYWDNKYAVIRIPIYIPAMEEFKIINRISYHIKSTWFSS